ncbi:c-type cytochrome [Oceaniglobus trochenteri]|uniref:c-type cytochrome n=1 Tax=Oceaniglobus trochenteri TaxID=2763260 RepID=UPI001CFFEFEC|nr:c-type cytochrome [Oceaniglobus trochenteri]
MNGFWIGCVAAGLLATPVLAESHVSGDAAAGEDAFRQCISCHVVQNDDGETLAGRNAKTGPNLYGVAGRQAGMAEGYRFGKSMKEAGEKGLEWTEEHFVAYVMDPTAYLREFLDDSKARGKMAFKVRKEEDAVNIYAYLASLAE